MERSNQENLKVSHASRPLYQGGALSSISVAAFPDYSKDLSVMCQGIQNEAKSIHRYIASSVFIQNGELVALLERDFQIELIEREMGSNALIIDSNSVILIHSLQSLPKVPHHLKSSLEKIIFLHETQLGNQILRLSAHFSMIYLLFHDVNSTHEHGVYSFTSPVLKSLASLNLFSSLILGRMHCKMNILFSSSMIETACLIRYVFVDDCF